MSRLWLDGELPACDAAQGSQAESFATFRNSYTPEPVSVPSEDFAAGTKTLTGRDMLPNETFGFVLLPWR